MQLEGKKEEESQQERKRIKEREPVEGLIPGSVQALIKQLFLSASLSSGSHGRNMDTICL